MPSNLHDGGLSSVPMTNNWAPNLMAAMPQPPGWYQVVCPGCRAQLQVQLTEGITSVQCGNCKCVFAVQIQQTAFAPLTKAPGPMVGKQGRKKKEKDPDRPPRTLSAYNLFMKDEVPNVKAKHPDLPHREIFKMAAERWAESPNNPKGVAPGAGTLAAMTAGGDVKAEASRAAGADADADADADAEEAEEEEEADEQEADEADDDDASAK